MNPLEFLTTATGRYSGKNTLYDPHTGKPDETDSTLRITPVLGGRFARVDYTWSYQGEPQEGSLLFGYDPQAGAASGYWIDTWHMGKKGLTCHGRPPSGGTIGVRGSYEAPPGPDWGWRIELTIADRTLKIVHTNIHPDGKEEPAVTADYTRA